MDGNLAAARFKDVAFYADNIADIPAVFHFPVTVFADLVDFHVDLNPAGAVIKIHEACLAHIPPAHNTASDTDILIFKLLKAVMNFLRSGITLAGRYLERVMPAALQLCKFPAPHCSFLLVLRLLLFRSQLFLFFLHLFLHYFHIPALFSPTF